MHGDSTFWIKERHSKEQGPRFNGQRATEPLGSQHDFGQNDRGEIACRKVGIAHRKDMREPATAGIKEHLRRFGKREKIKLSKL